MTARISLAFLAAALLGSAGANAACSPGQTRNCTPVDLNAVPEITQQIVARERVAPAPNQVPPFDTGANRFYTGPMVDVTTNKARRTPTIGYHWSID